MSAYNLLRRIHRIPLNNILKPRQNNILRGLSDSKDGPCRSSLQELCGGGEKSGKSTCKSDAGGKGGSCFGGSEKGIDPNLPKGLAKIRTMQERFQRDDGAPIFLKMGMRDQILYRLTVALALVGIGSIIKMAAFDMK